MEKKYQIFISSTFDDLKEERQAVIEAILRMHHFPVGMEWFGAMTDEQWDVIKETIDSSDYYVLIVGHRYGTIIPGEKISYTQREFEYAIEKNIPTLVFLINDEVPVKAKFVEKEHISEFDNFKAEIKEGRTVVWWSDKGDLASKVATSLYNHFKTHPRMGWVRGESIEDDQDTGLQGQINQLRRAQKWQNIDHINDEISLISQNIKAVVLIVYGSKTDLGKITVTKSIKASVCDYHVGNYTISCDSHRETLEWKSAIELLEKTGLLECRNKGILYELTDEGYFVGENYISQNGLQKLEDPKKTLQDLMRAFH